MLFQLGLAQLALAQLALNTNMSQVSASAVIFQRPLASHSLIKTFIQNVTLPFNLWHLNWVQRAVFEVPRKPIRDSCFSTLTEQVAYFVAWTKQVSDLATLFCKEPLLVLHRDKVVVRPRTTFLRWFSAFHWWFSNGGSNFTFHHFLVAYANHYSNLWS